jgi:hypothetical protein
MRRLLAMTASASAVGMAAGCSLPSDAGGVFTLYRNSPIDATMRIHMATFDSEDGEAYNRVNCDIAVDLFMKQPGVTARYWCEKGRFRK